MENSRTKKLLNVVLALIGISFLDLLVTMGLSLLGWYPYHQLVMQLADFSSGNWGNKSLPGIGFAFLLIFTLLIITIETFLVREKGMKLKFIFLINIPLVLFGLNIFVIFILFPSINW